jgi:hypothetical protein
MGNHFGDRQPADRAAALHESDLLAVGTEQVRAAVAHEELPAVEAERAALRPVEDGERLQDARGGRRLRLGRCRGAGVLLGGGERLEGREQEQEQQLEQGRTEARHDGLPVRIGAAGA